MTWLHIECPRDREQTHFSLLTHLVKETCKAIDTAESSTDDDLREELGDLLLQVYFHTRIAENKGRFTIDDVAHGTTDKLTRRYPCVFGGDEVLKDLRGVWEHHRRQEKRRASSLDGIARSMSFLVHTQKIIARTRLHEMLVGFPSKPATTEDMGERVQASVARAQTSGVDADAAVREALRSLEERVRQTEGSVGTT